MKTTLLRLFAAAMFVALSPAPAVANDSYPSKTVRIVVPYPAGGTSDSIARLFAARLASSLKGTVIVENKSGASGTIGAETVVRADPDGHTLLLTVTTQLSNVAVNVRPNYDPITDFAPIAGLTLAPMALAVPPSLPVNSVKELEALARTQKLAYGSYGIGTSGHVMLATFNRKIDGQMVHVPYRGESPMVTDMLGGQIQLGLLTVGIARELQKAGKVKLLASVGSSRSEFLPKVPTFGELGYGGFDWTYGVALYTSSRVPPAIVERLERASLDILKTPDFQQQLRTIGAEPWGAPAAELKKRLVIDTVLWNRTLASFGKLE